MTGLRFAMTAFTAGSILLLSGCANSIVFTTSNLTGIELNAIEGGQQTIKVGYQRVEGVTMPMRKTQDAQGKEVYQEAYSVLAVSSLQSGGFLMDNLGDTRITQVFATGEAARTRGVAEAMTNSVKALGSGLIDKPTVDVSSDIMDIIESASGDPVKSATVIGTVNGALGSSAGDLNALNKAVYDAAKAGRADELGEALSALRAQGF